ncbi:MAG: HEAT repeat domain-containing protein [Bryobacteraceae bacterium]
MDPILSAAAAAIVGAVDWREVAKKLAGDAATDAAKAGQRSLLRLLRPDEREKAAKQAIGLFTEEFLKELDDKTPLSAAVPGYRDQLQRLIESAAVDITSWLQPEIKSVDLGPVARMWSYLNLSPLPEDFDWQLVARNYARAIRQHIKQDPELRQQLAIALQEDSRSFEQRLAPGFDLAGYRDFLRNKCGMLHLSAMHASTYDRRITLWSVFVPQSAREAAPVRDMPRELLRQLRREGHAADVADEEQVARLRETYQSSPVTGVLDVLARQHCVVLLGDPGSGKTSLLKYLVLKWITENQGPLPLWIDLKELAGQLMPLKAYLDSGNVAFGLDARDIEERLREGQAALYLDGLDEIFHAPTRASVVEQIASFSARYPRASVVVTSRIIGYEPERLRDFDFTHATLEDFDDEQVRTFLSKWHAVSEDDAKERTRLQNRLEQALKDSRAIRELAGNPLLLTMMAILNRNQELPRDRVELYREVSRVLLHEWDASRSLLPTDTFARQEKEALLKELAGEMQQTDEGLAGNLIEREGLVQVFRKFLAGLGIQDAYSKAESLVQQLTERNFILCFAGADRFAFVHRTFLEYFCAAWFVEQFEKRRTLSLDQLKLEVFGRHWQDEKWHEVLRLIAGMVGEKQAGELILFLMGLDGRDHKLANLMLAAGCLSEVRNRRAVLQIDQALRGRLIADAVTYDPPYYYEAWEENEETGPTRAKAVALIASIWRSAETREWLLSTAKPSQDWIVRQAAVQELARGWKDDPETLPLLKDCARSDGDGAVRFAAVQELARGWKDDPETLPLLKDRARFDKDNNVRSAAVQELARGWKDDFEKLPLLRDRARLDEDHAVRSAAVQELARGWKDDPETLSWLTDRTRYDESDHVRAAALHELARGWKDDPETLALLKDCARSDGDSAVRAAALHELARGWKGDPETLPLLNDAARYDENFAVRTAAAQELARGWKDDPVTLPLLKDRARSDKNGYVRLAALQELARGWKDDPETLPLLKNRACHDHSHAARTAALRELLRGWKDDSETLPLLKDRALSDEGSDVRRAAVRQLARGWKDDPETLPLLKDRARSDENYAVRRAALGELARGRKDDPETLALLKDRALSDEDSDVRMVAVRELARSTSWHGAGRTIPGSPPCFPPAERSDRAAS